MTGLRHDAGIVSAIGQHESELRVGEQMQACKTERQGAMSSVSVPTLKIGARMSFSAITLPSTA